MTLPPALRWADAELATLAGVHGLLTDLDDTLTRDGVVEPPALAALQALRAAGVPVIAITGRPVGWSEALIPTLPVAAIVAENGAVMLRHDGAAVRRDFAQDAATRAQHAARLSACAADVLAQVPGARLARDSAGRLTDIAVDHSEFTHLPPAAIDQVVRLMQAHGLTATVSSIHINGWIGAHSKWTGAGWAVAALLGEPLRPADWLFVGDSTNDQAMFERLPLSVGVANIARFWPQLRHYPRWVTAGERGQGFAQVCDALLAARALRPAPGRSEAA